MVYVTEVCLELASKIRMELVPSRSCLQAVRPQWYTSYRFVDSLRAGSGWNWFRPDPVCKLSARNGIRHTGLLTACEQDQNGTGSVLILLSSRQETCMTHTIAVCTVKTPDDGQRNYPKHVEFYSKNKFQKFVHLVGFIIRMYHDARSPERQMLTYVNKSQVATYG